MDFYLTKSDSYIARASSLLPLMDAIYGISLGPESSINSNCYDKYNKMLLYGLQAHFILHLLEALNPLLDSFLYTFTSKNSPSMHLYVTSPFPNLTPSTLSLAPTTPKEPFLTLDHLIYFLNAIGPIFKVL